MMDAIIAASIASNFALIAEKEFALNAIHLGGSLIRKTTSAIQFAETGRSWGRRNATMEMMSRRMAAMSANFNVMTHAWTVSMGFALNAI